jgi:hypothetical protein
MANTKKKKDDVFIVNQNILLDIESMSLNAESITGNHKSNVHSVVDGVHLNETRGNRRKNRRLKTELECAEKLFKCGCGKNYLSYAALYTHTKVKHNGLFPEGTDAGEKKKQGRPKVVDFDQEKIQRLDSKARDDSKEEESVQ